MENADALDLSKENIQPLKRGRNTAQLGFALQAQSDPQLQQMLNKKLEWFEMRIRTYDGTDPLEVWCDYVSWVEQSFPKHGPEANLTNILSKCFQALKEYEKYKNDVRFVRLWIKYIEMQNDNKRVEMYQLLHSQGIGLKCAEFYRSWAYEYECVEDWKQAEAIYVKGLSNHAQPVEELQIAHSNFSATLCLHLKNASNEEPDDFESNLQADHRMPMAALKPVGKKSAAPNVRVGSNVKNQVPGLVTSVQGSSGRPPSRSFGVRGNNAGPVTIYQGEPEPEPTYGQIVPTAVPLPQSLNKENLVKAGSWTGQGLGSRKHQTTTINHTLVPRQPGFEVHKDEDIDAASGHDIRPLGVMPHALQPRKGLEVGFQDAISIFEEPNPFDKPMYRKTEVYSGAKEFQLEELHALDYFRKRAERERTVNSEGSFLSNHTEENDPYSRKLISASISQSSNGIVHGQNEDREMDEIQELRSTENSTPIVGIEPTISSYDQHHPHTQPLSMYGSTSETVAGAHCSVELHHEQPHQGHRFQPSNQSMNNQSMTIHTKLAMNEVDPFWSSPTVAKTPACGPSVTASSAPNMYHPQSEFHVLRDDSLSQQVHENSPSRNSDPQSYSQNQFCKSRVESFGPAAPSALRGHPEPERGIESFSIHPSDNYRLYDDPMTQTSYMKHLNGFHAYQEEPYPAVSQPAKFTVFCDEGENAAPTRSLSGERTDLSSSTHTSSSSIQKIAREKENIHKFPQADIELHEDCGAATIPERPEQLGWQQQHNTNCNYNMGTSSYAPQLQSQPISYMDHNLHGPMHPHPATSHDAMSGVGHMAHPSHSVTYDTMQGGTTYAPMQNVHSMAYGSTHHDLMYPSYIPNQQAIHEPMEDDATVAAAPIVGVNMSETGITEAFFHPNMGAMSTPYQTSPKKSRASKEPVDFNSSLYRCELSWPDEDGGADCNRPDAPKTVPPLKLFRIKNDGDQLSAIMESSKEKYQSVLSSGSSRNSTSAFIPNRQGMLITPRQSFQPQLCLNHIEESSEPLSSSSSSQEGQAQVQVPAQGPDLKQMNEMSMRLERGEINPFDNRLLEYFLYKMSFPLPHHTDGYHSLSSAVPAKRNNCLNLGGTLFSVSKVLGEGAYAKVLKAVNTSIQKEVALKIQKPSCRWEYYICREIQQRLSQHDLTSAFMPADQIFVYNNGSIIVTDLLPFGTLLNLVNKVVASTKRPMLESQALFLLDQLISAVKALHDCKIIHGDLKPDNVLLRAIPSTTQMPCIQLIDFGRSIDMTLMPAGTMFSQVVMTDTFTCIEMRTNKPWTYQTDLFGLANTAHCLLLGDYMKVQEIKSTSRWAIQSKLPRHVNSEFWGTFFDTLLNIESCDALPDLETLRADVQSSMSNSGQLQLAVSALGRLMLSR